MSLDQQVHIIPGYKCNMFCRHCGVGASPDNKKRVSDKETNQIIADINIHNPKRIHFTGGEPTLYLDVVNYILKNTKRIKGVYVSITTNGLFIRDRTMSDLLGKFYKLNHVQLSYDSHHKPKLSHQEIRKIAHYCVRNSISFNISVAISEPQEIKLAKEISNKTGCDVLCEKVVDCGRAHDNKLSFEYPLFDSDVLNQKCPNLHQICYHPGKGYSICCSNLAFNKDLPYLFHKEIQDHLNSEFYNRIKQRTFGELLNESNIKITQLGPADSQPCNLCERIFSS
ncbi:MAG: radical SAM protein [Deltaproteobacteria bacterium]|nr:radical SAM protein [Deltaproteobacteria bacterium]